MWNPFHVFRKKRSEETDRIDHDIMCAIEAMPKKAVMKNTTKASMILRLNGLYEKINGDSMSLDTYLRFTDSIFILSVMCADHDAALRCARLNMEIWRRINDEIKDVIPAYFYDKKVRNKWGTSSEENKVPDRRGRRPDSELREDICAGRPYRISIELGRHGVTCREERGDSCKSDKCVADSKGLPDGKAYEDTRQSTFEFFRKKDD